MGFTPPPRRRSLYWRAASASARRQRICSSRDSFFHAAAIACTGESAWAGGAAEGDGGGECGDALRGEGGGDSDVMCGVGAVRGARRTCGREQVVWEVVGG